MPAEWLDRTCDAPQRPPADCMAAIAAAQEAPRDAAADDEVARSACGDEHRRIWLGSHHTTPPELLYFLACDPSLQVRAAVAMNQAAPPQADQQLVRDADPRIRMVLARKLAALAPGLSTADQMRLSAYAWDNLAILVHDAADKVRAAVAELVSDMDAAPRALILQLAADATFSVSDPVLRLSPVLTEEDLVGLVSCAPAPHTVCSIARRVKLTEAVSDAIVRTAGREAVAALLGNPSASIRESTLDALVADAAAHEDWQEPLIRRPRLSPRNARLLGSFVAEQLVRLLCERTDLDSRIVRELDERLQAMIAPQTRLLVDHDACMLAQAQALAKAGELTEEQIIDAIRSGDATRVDALLATAAGVPLAAVRRAAKLRSAKAVISLIWQAGFTMRLAGPLQSFLCDLAPAAMLHGSRSHAYPLSDEEMRWQLQFVTHP